MMTRTWIGGGNNRASNPQDWSPTGVPQAGDLLQAGGSVNFNPTMNVSGNDLAGDSIDIIDIGSFTGNLIHKAIMSARLMFGGGNSTFNVSQQSTLEVEVSRALATINLSRNSTLDLFFDRTLVTVNISGNDTAVMDSDTAGGTIVNLDPGARWSGTTDLSLATVLTVSGAAGSVFNNDGNSILGGSATINADVIGKGSMNVSSGGKLEFVQSVGSHQSITDTSIVQIDKPKEFAASITLAAPAAGNSPAEIDLEGLAKAGSYTFKNDMLRLFSGNKVIDTLRLTDQTQYGFAVEKTASSVNIVGIDPTHPATGTLLPIHS